jgi:beta-lactamase superfamily II metal-dependent hydrolase
MAKYEYEILKVCDADVIFIRHYIQDGYGEKPYIILIDAGNVKDSELIKKHLKNYYGTYKIDLAICTHPDNDHMGGFFGLLDDDDIFISEFWLIDPAEYLNETDIKYIRNPQSAKKAVRIAFNKPQDSSRNLINDLEDCGINLESVYAGKEHDILPIKVVAPNKEYYCEIAKNMFEEDTYEPADTSQYDEAAQVNERQSKSVIDEDDDTSANNQSSIVLLYEPEIDKQILFTGDTTCASLTQMLEDFPEIKNIDLLKVPHHGSKHNLNSVIIDTLKPKKSYISAAGTRKHPSSAIVRYLSKYGNVYSTHKCNDFIHCANGINRENTKSVEPLKKKQ